MIQAFSTPEATVAALADRVVTHLTTVEGEVRVVIPGGATPRRLFEVLIQEPFYSRMPWPRIRWVLSDERCVGPKHPDSNFGMVWDSLWRHAPVSGDHIVRFRGELPPPQAVEVANSDLSAWTKSNPLFHLVLLGVGEDGHTASIFPSTRALNFGTFPVAKVFHPQRGDRLTLTPDALRQTQALWFLALGQSKAQAVRQTLSAKEGSSVHPIRLLPLDRSQWFLDDAAARLLEKDER